MLIGVPKEIKNHEYRIGLTPAGVGEVRAGEHFEGTVLSAGVTLCSGSWRAV